MKPVVVKVGGSTLGSHDTAIEDIAAIHKSGRAIIVVHGGGNAATEWLNVRGVPSEFVGGLRVTGPDAIDVVTAVFGGLVNKQLVAQLLAQGAMAVGIAGLDGGMVATSRRDERLGFVGDIEEVRPRLLSALLGAGFLPVIAPLAFWTDSPRQIMNVNADTIAGEIAVAADADVLVFLTDVPGVKDERGEWASEIDAGAARRLIDGGIATGGMAPKLEACISAAAAGVRARIVDGREAHALKRALDGVVGGTTISPPQGVSVSNGAPHR
jgi:acetylglutamate kinase